MDSGVDHSVAVVGAGCVGLCVAAALLDLGIDVKVYETSMPGAGQSAGSSRIFRLNHADPRMIPLAKDAKAIIRRWETAADTEFLSADGVVCVGSSGPQRFADLVAHGGGVENLGDGAGATLALPIARGWEGEPAFIDIEGGALWTERLVSFLVRKLVGRIVPRRVLALTAPRSQGVEVFTSDGPVTHRAAVVAAGVETPHLMSGLGVTIPVMQTLHLRGTFSPTASIPRACLQDGSSAYGAGTYAAPTADYKAYTVGLSGPDGELTDVTEGGLARVRTLTQCYVEAALPGLDPVAIGWTVCPVTRVPWGSDGAACWTHNNVAAVAGHNLWKWAPILGELLAHWAETSDLDSRLAPAYELGRT